MYKYLSLMLAGTALIAAPLMAAKAGVKDENLEVHVMAIVKNKKTGQEEKILFHEGEPSEAHKQTAKTEVATLSVFGDLASKAIASGGRKLARVITSENPLETLKQQAIKAVSDSVRTGSEVAAGSLKAKLSSDTKGSQSAPAKLPTQNDQYQPLPIQPKSQSAPAQLPPPPPPFTGESTSARQLPPPPPPMNSGAKSAPQPSSARSGLMNEIRSGVTLKKVETAKPAAKADNLTSQLNAAINNRRKSFED
jgi:hypothetical protein